MSSLAAAVGHRLRGNNGIALRAAHACRAIEFDRDEARGLAHRRIVTVTFRGFKSVDRQSDSARIMDNRHYP